MPVNTVTLSTLEWQDICDALTTHAGQLRLVAYDMADHIAAEMLAEADKAEASAQAIAEQTGV